MKTARLRPAGFTLVEIMIVVAIIAILAGIGVPSFLRARKRSQAASILEDLRSIDSAMDQYALEYGRSLSNPLIPVAAWQEYLKPGSRLASTGADIFGHVYGDQQLGVLPTVPAASYDSLSDVAGPAFWSPYVRSTP